MGQFASHSRGFTITELIVAIGVTLVLLLGVSRIFSMTSDTISIGEAVAEVNQRGRAVERIMRQDLAGITRGGFLVVRNERIGVRLPGTPDRARLEQQRRNSPNFEFNGEPRLVYLNEEMEEFDNSAESDVEKSHHLGMRRLDQLIFFTEGDHTSYQFREFPPGFGQGQIARNVTAPAARIWYGHTLRDREPFSASVAGEIKRGPGLGLQAYKSHFADPTGTDEVNKYAEAWTLGRHEALLRPLSDDPSVRAADLQQLQYAPSIFEFFNENQLPWARTGSGGRLNDPLDPTQRLSAGYVDLIDTSLAQVEKTVTEYGERYSAQNGRVLPVSDPVWRSRDWNPTGIWNDDALQPRYVANYVQDLLHLHQIGDDVAELWARGQQLRMILSTGRIRTESAPPSIRRIDQMLAGAALAQACSNFEVAWSTGEATYPEGRIAWYDIENPANPYLPAWNYRESRAQTWEERRAQAPGNPITWYISEWPAPEVGNPTPELEYLDLYYASFGYFVPREKDDPAAVDDRSEPWPWPTMLRIRLTLHDTNGRLPNGRDFEFIVNLPETVGSRD